MSLRHPFSRNRLYSGLVTLFFVGLLSPLFASGSRTLIKDWRFADTKTQDIWSKNGGQTTLTPDENHIGLTGTEKSGPRIWAKVAASAGRFIVQIELRTTSSVSATLYWTTPEVPGFHPSQRVDFYRIAENGPWQTFEAVFNVDSSLTGLRLDPLGKPGKTDIRRIALYSVPATSAADAAGKLKLLPGFEAELVYKVPKSKQGSWVSMTFDDKGRIIASDQYKGLFRVTVDSGKSGAAMTKVESLDVGIGAAQGLCYAFDSLYVVVSHDFEKGKIGFYRLRDTDGDDRFEEVKMLRAFNSRSEHGLHGVVLGPDGKQLYIVGGNDADLPEPEKSLPPRVWQEDLLLPRMWDARGHAKGRLAPGGWIARTDAEGKTWELVSIGYRNQYDLAFNPAGDLFTYDADMEWDIGTSWYRPTRVNHVVSGSDFGWRSGTGKWAPYFPDSLPATIDIGTGSPTGIVFGTGSRFPAKYQRALFLSDWSYGKVYAVHLTPEGASYTASKEVFLSGTPLPITDLEVSPTDGMLYFVVGGRKTESAIYRVRYTGNESTVTVNDPQGAPNETAQLRRTLEGYHRQDPAALSVAWPHLANPDRFVRYAARIAVEHQDVASWQDRVLSETRPIAIIEGTVALARHGGKELRDKLIEKLDQLDWSQLDQPRRLSLLRAYSLVFIRMGKPEADQVEKIVTRFDQYYPAKNFPLNRELSRLLIFLESPEAARKTVALMTAGVSQEQQIHYALSLRTLNSGWTHELRERYFEWFHSASGLGGGMSFSGFVKNIKSDAVSNLPSAEKTALAKVLADRPASDAAANRPVPKGPGKAWTLDELVGLAGTKLKQRDFENGKAMFSAVMCYSCHRFAGGGGAVGPDLTGAAGRFGVRDLVEAILDPSKEISDQYQATVFELVDGTSIVGKMINMFGDSIDVSTNLFDPSEITKLPLAGIKSQKPSPVSEMPPALLYMLNEDEVLDLLAYLLSRGDAKDPMFSK